MPLVLVTEDEPALRNAYGEILLSAGFQPMLFENASDSYQAFCDANGAVALVITDGEMPGSGGAGLARRIRDLDSNVPIVLISGVCERYAAAEFRPLFTTMLEKPVSAKTFREMLGNFFFRFR